MDDAQLMDNGNGASLYSSSRSRTSDVSFKDRHHANLKNVPEEMVPKPEMFDESCAPTSHEIRHYSMKQSRRLGGWKWILLAKSLGIKTHEFDKPLIGTIFYVFTLTTGFTYGAAKIWFSAYDIASEITPSTVFTGAVEMIVAIFWVASGIYAHSLAGDLFSNPRFRDGVRVHSKTLFRISAIKLMIILAVAAVSIDSYRNWENFKDVSCEKVNVTTVICKVMFPARVSFSLIAIIWNTLCGSVLFSVCRTHTIVLRRFIKELEKDGLLFELGWAKRREQQLVKETDITSVADGEFLWDDEIPAFPSDFEPGTPSSNTIPIGINDSRMSSAPFASSPSLRRNMSDSFNAQRNVDFVFEETGTPGAVHHDGLFQRNFSVNSVDGEASTYSLGAQREPGMLSVNQILISWWKLQCRLHVASLALQRWLFCWIAFITVISANFITMWLKVEATAFEVAEFILPILLLPLLCSAYAEVNYECSRVTRAIVPLGERLQLLRYFLAQPLQITMFGSPVSYSSIATVITAVGVAFATKIIFDEFSKVKPL